MGIHGKTKRPSISNRILALTFPLGGNLNIDPVKSISSLIFGENLQCFHRIPRDQKVPELQPEFSHSPSCGGDKRASEIKCPTQLQFKLNFL